MKENYNINGYFYQIEDSKFRKYLNIKKKSSTLEKPDLMIIMMNPGSSYPLDDNDDGNIETPTNPDPTQNQIMHIMEQCSFEYARVLNLSDYREAKSSVFYGRISSLPESHSIFHPSRQNDFDNLFERNVPIIYAWGVNKKLMQLAKNAIHKTKTDSLIFGLNKKKYDFSYYHPLPRSAKKQTEWIDQIKEELLNYKRFNL